MNRYVKFIGLSLVLSSMVMAAPKKWGYEHYKVPQLPEASFEDPEYTQIKKEWTKQKRKIASEMSFNAGDMSKDLQKLRDEWLQVKTGDEMEALLKRSYANYNSFSEDTRYFLAQMHLAIPLRGIVWRLRPLFENNRGFLGNKSTHVTAIQSVRGAIEGLKMFLPTKQSDAGIEYFTEPSPEMGKADQFKSIAQVQQFLTDTMVPAITEATNKILALSKSENQKAYVWDNKIAFGRATFEDDVRRFVGHGPAEMNFVIASLYRAQHRLMVYSAYNQDHAIKVAGELGSRFGIDATPFSSQDLGLTAEERVKVIKSATQKHHFLELRNYEGSTYGSKLMKQAYIALKNSVVYFERAYDYLQGREASKAFAFNPILFQSDYTGNMDKAIKNMKAVVSGPAEIRDPVTGDTAVINLPAFYHEPPQSLGVLMATGFETGANHKTIVNKKGESLEVRNYTRGRSIAWDNESWKKYVPSAEGKGPGYMAEARRIIQYSFGTSIVFGLPNMFVD